MRAWTIHDPAPAAAPSASRARDIVTVKDGFAWWALFFPLIWLVIRQLWWGAFSYIVAFVLLGLAAHYLSFAGAGVFLLYLLIHLWIAFDGNDMRRRRLLSQGYAEIARVPGASRDDAEQRFFARWLPAPGETPQPPPPHRSPPAPRRPDDPQVIGLFPEPGGGR
jgi:hypothetical protein